MRCRPVELPSTAKQRGLPQLPRKILLLLQELFGVDVEYRKTHPAANVHTHRGGNNRAFRWNDAANGRTDAPMDIRHSRNPLKNEWELGNVNKLFARGVFQRHTLHPSLNGHALLRL